MLGGAERSNGDFAILGASVLMDTLAIVGAVDVHFPATVGAIHQPCQRCGLAPAVRVSLDVPPNTLYVVKGFLADDSVMGVLENRPFALVNIVALFVLEVLAGLKIDGMTQVFPLFQNVDDGGRTPAVNVLDRLGTVHPLVKSRQMYRWNFNLVLGQLCGDLIGAVASQRHGEDTPY